MTAQEARELSNKSNISDINFDYYLSLIKEEAKTGKYEILIPYPKFSTEKFKLDAIIQFLRSKGYDSYYDQGGTLVESYSYIVVKW